MDQQAILELILVSCRPLLSAGGQFFCSEDDEGAQNPHKSQARRQVSPDSTSGLDVSQDRAFWLARGCRESPCPKGISLWVWIPQPGPHLQDLTTSNWHTGCQSVTSLPEGGAGGQDGKGVGSGVDVNERPTGGGGSHTRMWNALCLSSRGPAWRS